MDSLNSCGRFREFVSLVVVHAHIVLPLDVLHVVYSSYLYSYTGMAN